MPKHLGKIMQSEHVHSEQLVAIVDASLNKDLKLDKTLPKNSWRVYVIDKRENAQPFIKQIRQSSDCDSSIHLIAHGEPGFLHLGKGISITEITNIADEKAKKGFELVIWGCEVGKKQSAAAARRKHLKAAVSMLGQGNTIEGYGELSKTISELEYHLNSWKSAGGLIKAEVGPTLSKGKEGETSWKLGKTSEISFAKNLKVAGNKFKKGLTIPGSINSEDANFSSWSFSTKSSDNQLTFKLPKGILSAYGRNNSGIIATIEIDNGKLKNWNTTADSKNLQLPGFSTTGSIGIDYDASSKILSLGGEGTISYLASTKNSLFKSNAEVSDLNFASKGKKVTISSWSANGGVKIKTSGLALTGEAGISYTKNNKENNYEIKDAELEADAGEIFQGKVNINALFKSTGKKKPILTSWNAKGKLAIPTVGLDINMPIDIEFQQIKDIANYNVTPPKDFTTNSATSILKGLIEIKELEIGKNEAGSWEAKSLNAKGKLTTGISDLGITGEIEADVSYSSEDSSYIINTIETSSKTKDALFSGEIIAKDVVLTRDSQKNWSPQTWQAKAALDLDLDGLDLSGEVDA
ncbi:MAG: DUF4347 domain-containing protein, partial [Prochlorococcus sp.]